MFTPRRPLSRRQWLQPRSSGTIDVRPSGLGDLLRARREGMGSYFEVRLPAQGPGALPLANRSLDAIGELEAQLSVYRDDSEVSRINDRAHREPVSVEPELFDLLLETRRLHQLTDGAYDVAIGALSAAWGFLRGPRRVPDAETLAEARRCSGQDLVELDPTGKTIRLARPGVALNLGSIGKGYALDRAARLIRDHRWPTPALLHGGRSSVLALGSPPGTLGGTWAVTLQNPRNPAESLGTFRLRDRGLGTSGNAFQRFESGGRFFGHLLDPRTGVPAQGALSVSVVAPSAALADALSTAFYLLGSEAVEDRFDQYGPVGVVFVEAGARVDDPPLVKVRGLDRSEFEPASSGSFSW